MKRGIFIVLEGGEGTGKSTIGKWLKQKLEKQGKKVFLTREPGGNGSPVAEKIRKIILDKNSKTFHHKVIIFDSNKVLTGSFNFTGAAQDKNDENSLIIESNYINTVYTDEFKRLWGSYTK